MTLVILAVLDGSQLASIVRCYFRLNLLLSIVPCKQRSGVITPPIGSSMAKTELWQLLRRTDRLDGKWILLQRLKCRAASAVMIGGVHVGFRAKCYIALLPTSPT